MIFEESFPNRSRFIVLGKDGAFKVNAFSTNYDCDVVVAAIRKLNIEIDVVSTSLQRCFDKNFKKPTVPLANVVVRFGVKKSHYGCCTMWRRLHKDL